MNWDNKSASLKDGRERQKKRRKIHGVSKRRRKKIKSICTLHELNLRQ